ncbi:CopM family metallochaperone [Falsiroseomonas sp. HC035]|uniref:CopM family metallochaperone n=1 Tax=Falsiroseomonas sp. HC035 TaxID=3390999 RepID=UPI003D321C3F
MSRLSIATALSLALAAPAFAQQGHHQHHAAPTPQRAAAEPPSTREFRAASERMHRDMGIALSGNADRDFAAGMIPHHQGAIEMARIQLRHGTDPEMRKLAEEIIQAQEAEIARLRAFLARSVTSRP